MVTYAARPVDPSGGVLRDTGAVESVEGRIADLLGQALTYLDSPLLEPSVRAPLAALARRCACRSR